MGYATTSELAAMGGLPSVVLAAFTTQDQQAKIDQASGIADGYLRSQMDPPLTGPIPGDLKLQVCRIAAYFLMRQKGFDPERGADVVIRDDYKDALAWLAKVASGAVVLDLGPTTTDQTPDEDESVPLVVSLPRRGI